MYKMKQIWKISCNSFSGWRRSPRVWMTFILAFVLCLMLSNQAITFSQTYGTYMQILEPFIWTFGDADSVMISSLLLMMLFSDMPFITEATPYYLIRTTRKIWLIGQVLYVVIATIIYALFLLIIECVLASPRSFVGSMWSETGAMIGYSQIGKEIALPASIKSMEATSPYQCGIVVFLLLLCYSLLMAIIMLFFNLTKNKMAGVIGVIVLNLYGLLLNPVVFQKLFDFTGTLEYRANLLCGWLSPLNHATYYMHNFGYDYLPRIWMSILIFLILIAGLLIGANMKMKKYDFSFTQIEGN